MFLCVMCGKRGSEREREFGVEIFDTICVYVLLCKLVRVLSVGG